MFKKLAMAAFLVGAGLALINPSAAQARDSDYESMHHHHRMSVMVGVAPRHYSDGYYSRWGYWHSYSPGYYDHRGIWHRS